MYSIAIKISNILYIFIYNTLTEACPSHRHCIKHFIIMSKLMTLSGKYQAAC
uniref:Uncharacterized protein n=1 Tax=Anguilla anguilla TaxID=7936 RepID=A0A0E9W960_ANGAN